MRNIKKITLLVFIIVGIAYGVGRYQDAKKDTVPPVILSENDEIHVAVGFSPEELLQGLTAKDDRDGDLTKEIMIGKVSDFTEKGVSKVEYLVFDKENNAGKYERTVHFDNYTSPKFELTKPLMYKINDTITMSDRLVAKDVITGDISNKIKFESANVVQNQEGIYQITVSVKNPFGDYVKESFPVNIVDTSEYGEQIQLNTYLLYVSAGSAISDPLSYVEKVTDENGAELDHAAIRVTQNVDTTVPGYGQVRYELDDASGKTVVTFMTVIVTE